MCVFAIEGENINSLGLNHPIPIINTYKVRAPLSILINENTISLDNFVKNETDDNETCIVYQCINFVFTRFVFKQ